MCLFGSASEWFLVHGWLYGDDIMMAAKGCTRVATRVRSDYTECITCDVTIVLRFLLRGSAIA